MNRFIIIMTGVLYVSLLALLNINCSFAEDHAALRFFQTGEQYYNDSKYEEAIKMYKKAIEERAYDGKIEFRTSKEKVVPYGRTTRTIVMYDSTYNDYFPNKRIQEIDNIFIKKKKDILLSKRLPPMIDLSIDFSEPSGNKILDAGETGVLIVNIKNSGSGEAFNVTLDVSCGDSKHVFFENSVLVGNLKPNSSSTKSIEIIADKKIETQTISFNIVAHEEGGFDSDNKIVKLDTQAFRPPKLIVADFGIDDPNGGVISHITPMKIVEVTARIQNVGYGTSRGSVVSIEKGENIYFPPDTKDTFEIDALKPGETKDIKFTFYTNNRIKNNQKIPLAIRIEDKDSESTSEKDLALVMNVPQKKGSELVIAGKKDVSQPPIILSTGLSVDVDSKIPETRVKNPDAIAVIIGNKNYSTAGVPSVDYADRDADMMEEYLIKTMGYSKDNILKYNDAPSGKFHEVFGGIDNHRGKLFRWVKENKSDVFIYYVGHGAPDLNTKKGFLLPVDVDPQYVATSGYSLDTFYKNLAKIPARSMVVVLDTCFSGNTMKGMIFKNISPALLSVEAPEFNLPNAAIFTSGDVDQVSNWYPEKKHSLFTYFFLKSLSNVVEGNKSNEPVTAEKIYKYVQENVPYISRRLGPEQTPRLIGKKDIVMIR